MKSRVLVNFTAFSAIALISYSAANAQIVEKVTETADKTREVTIDTTKKTVGLTGNAADKTKNATVEVAATNNSGAKRNGSYRIELVDDFKGQNSESGRWLTVTSWDGAKWVSKRTWSATKKAAVKTKSAGTGGKDKKQ